MQAHRGGPGAAWTLGVLGHVNMSLWMDRVPQQKCRGESEGSGRGEQARSTQARVARSESWKQCYGDGVALVVCCVMAASVGVAFVYVEGRALMADYRTIMSLLVESWSCRQIDEVLGWSQRDIARARKVIAERGIAAEKLGRFNHTVLTERIRGRIADKRVQGLVRAF